MYSPRPEFRAPLSFASLGYFVGCLAVILGLTLAELIDPLPQQVYGATCFAVLAVLTYRTWRQTSGGNHPIFLFMVFLMLFQSGRLFSWAVFGEWSISLFDLTTPTPFVVPDAILKKSMLLVPLSASFVYLGYFYRSDSKALTFGKNDQMRWFFGWLFLTTVPFVLFKDISYLRYTLANGGYVATYLDNGEHLDQVGLVIRALALLNTMAFLPYIIVESRKKQLLAAMTLYLMVMILELLVGFRGKFFVNLMFLWMVYNIKRESSFKPFTFAIAGVAFAAVAIAAAIFRENQRAINVNLVEFFLRTQGVSFYVTVSSVMYYNIFHAHAWSYLIHQFWTPYKLLSTFGNGQLFTLDLTGYLNPKIVSYALGTGEAYLAHLYLLGGVPVVCLGSFVIGYLSLVLSRAKTIFWQTISISILMWIPYMPRAGYMEPIATESKYFIMACAGFALYAVFFWVMRRLNVVRSRVSAHV
jgi:hypothetical protein